MLRRPKKGELLGLYTASGRAVSTHVYSISHEDVFILIDEQKSRYGFSSSIVESLILTSRGLFLAILVDDKSEIA